MSLNLFSIGYLLLGMQSTIKSSIFFHSEASLEKTQLLFANGYLFLPIFSLILLSFSYPRLILHSSIPMSKPKYLFYFQLIERSICPSSPLLYI